MKNSNNGTARTVEKTRNTLHDHEANLALVEGFRGTRPGRERGMQEGTRKKSDEVSMQFRIPVL